mmetsp:Transcript_205/g.541  ORF Transcript_205/g.541 Transcript_205/m.541 type:complete len:260 (-) Transcript_205:865-1644(-)
MKKSSTKTTPKGRTPPMRTEGTERMYQICSGICRGMAFVRTGGSIVSLLKPRKLPRKTRGRLRANQKRRRATRVPKGTAPVPWSPHIMRLSAKKMRKTTPGNNVAVRTVFLSLSVPAPLNILQKIALTYPAGSPMKTKKRIMTSSSEPLFEGERKPSTANEMVQHDIPKTCIPDPMKTASSEACFGGRNTSPYTSFHPVSSRASSRASSLWSSWLYLYKSFLRILSMIMATIPDRKSRMTDELTMLNQWISSSCHCIWR